MATPAAPPQPETASKERFFRYFQHEAAALQDQMARLASTSPIAGERADAIDHCLAGISRLSSEVKDAAAYIPAYDQRTYGEAIKALSEKLQGVRNELGGTKKFSFKTKKNASAISIGEAAEMAQNKKLLGPGREGWSSAESSTLPSAMGSAFAPTPLEKLSPGEEKKEAALVAQNEGDNEKDGYVAGEKGVTVSGHDGAHIVLPASASQSASSGTVSNVRHSVVDLSPSTTNGEPFATLTLKDIKDSLVVCGQVSGPIHMTSVENSVLVTSCRQFRMHASKNVNVYLHCSSRPIIEDCEDIRFAPLPQAYMVDELSTATNSWDQIDDFKWLKAEPSPHFSILAEAERVTDEIWKDTVAGGHNVSVDAILLSVGASPSS